MDHNDTTATSASLQALIELDRNTRLCTYQHFYEADKNKKLNVRLGIPIVLINILLGSVFFVSLSEEIIDIAKWIGAFLALIAAGLSGIMTFFNFNNLFEGHRRLANRYLALSRECERVRALDIDKLIKLDDLSAELKNLNRLYEDINMDAEAYPANPKAFSYALKREQLRQKGLKDRYGSGMPDPDEGILEAEKLRKKSK